MQHGERNGFLPCPFPPHHPEQIKCLQRRAAKGLPLFHPFDARLEESHGYVPKRLHIDHVAIAALAKWDGFLWRIYARKREIDNRIRSRQKKWRNRAENGTASQREKAKLRMRAFRAEQKKEKEARELEGLKSPITHQTVSTRKYGMGRDELLRRVGTEIEVCHA